MPEDCRLELLQNGEMYSGPSSAIKTIHQSM